MKPTSGGDRLALQVEVAELRQQLAETQDQGVELAVDAGELHMQIQALQQGWPACGLIEMLGMPQLA